jgi:hypothetical protein
VLIILSLLLGFQIPTGFCKVLLESQKSPIISRTLVIFGSFLIKKTFQQLVGYNTFAAKFQKGAGKVYFKYKQKIHKLPNKQSFNKPSNIISFNIRNKKNNQKLNKLLIINQIRKKRKSEISVNSIVFFFCLQFFFPEKLFSIRQIDLFDMIVI